VRPIPPSPSPTATESETPDSTPTPEPTPSSEGVPAQTESASSDQTFIVVAERGSSSEELKTRAVALGISVEIMLQGVVEGITAELNPRERAELSTQPGVDYIEEDKIVSIESTAIRNDAGCTVNSLGNVDDASSGSLPLGFNVNWFGTQYTGIIVNNNGGITFDDGLGGLPFLPGRQPRYHFCDH